MRVVLLLTVLLTAMLAGCTTSDETVRVAFVTKDTATAPHEDLERLADFLSHEMGRDVQVDLFTSANAALEAVRFGQADVASVDGAAGWLAWQRLGLEAIASELRADGRTHYIAAAWTLNGTGIESADDFAGADSCHTGATKSAGMLMPMSYLVANGHIDASGYEDDISQVQVMAEDFFGTATIGGAYAGYNGALKCLSEGVGKLAFVRDSTPMDYCDDNAQDWCLDLDAYVKVVDFGPVPEHPFMVSGDSGPLFRAQLADALVALNDSDEGKDILDKTFGTHGIAKVDSESHLGAYGALVENLPGITNYAESK